jgi:probable F420-dependent oxidoreductase
MKIAGPFPYSGPLATRENVAGVARAVEAMGYDFIWMGEHIYYPKQMKAKYPYTPDGSLPIQPTCNYFEIVTALTYVAALTTKLRLHTNILMPAIRSPFLAAKQLATLDYLSEGRLNVALGLGWMSDEYELVGTPWKERGRYLNEWIVAICAFMAGEAFAGDYFSFGEAWFEPKPVQKPLPFWIGGDSDAAVVRAAELGDGWEPVGPGDAGEKSAWLAERLGRIAEIRAGRGLGMDGFSVMTSCGYQGVERGASAWRAAKDQLQAQIGQLAEAGVSHLIVRFNELNAAELQPVMDEAQWFAEELLPWAHAL